MKRKHIFDIQVILKLTSTTNKDTKQVEAFTILSAVTVSSDIDIDTNCYVPSQSSLYKFLHCLPALHQVWCWLTVGSLPLNVLRKVTWVQLRRQRTDHYIPSLSLRLARTLPLCCCGDSVLALETLAETGERLRSPYWGLEFGHNEGFSWTRENDMLLMNFADFTA